MVEEGAIVFVIDDDPSMRLALEDLVSTVGLEVRAFATPQEFLAWDERIDVSEGARERGPGAARDFHHRPRGHPDERAGDEGGRRRVPQQAVSRSGSARCNSRGDRA